MSILCSAKATHGYTTLRGYLAAAAQRGKVMPPRNLAKGSKEMPPRDLEKGSKETKVNNKKDYTMNTNNTNKDTMNTNDTNKEQPASQQYDSAQFNIGINTTVLQRLFRVRQHVISCSETIVEWLMQSCVLASVREVAP